MSKHTLDIKIVVDSSIDLSEEQLETISEWVKEGIDLLNSDHLFGDDLYRLVNDDEDDLSLEEYAKWESNTLTISYEEE